MTARRPKLRLAARALAGVVVVGAAATWLSTDHLRAFGGSPDLAKLRRSPHFDGLKFENTEYTPMMAAGSSLSVLRHWLFGHELRAPNCPLPLYANGAAELTKPPASEVRVTWLGHSSTIVEVDGVTILTDPVWSERASPSRWVGPRRFHPPPIALAELPHLDAVVISHEHYDHLDEATVQALAKRGVVFHVPLGIGAHLTAWNVPAAQIVEHDWWQAASLPHEVQLVSVPARHFNGRGVPWRIGASWTSWAVIGPRHRVFYSGDTGLHEALREIGARLGPFDVAMLEIGQYDKSWGNIHLGPLGALEANERVRGRVLFPIHWATFQLGMHDWSEPAETLTTEAAKRHVAIVTPRLGEPIEPTTHPTTPAWWRALPPIAASCPH
ncbi:MAG TPA: MBL fold metallo-hydrolase [Polyangia bacterium]|jgi:L-ascorbate metabolism protein UlaG (beta-lactamase superfamily)|nr:MBL fold metallo-hydrolase [Polyangia bacterium]